MEWSRREVLGGVAGSFGAAMIGGSQPAASKAQTKARQRPDNEPFGYCLNTSTIRGNKLDIVGVVAAASKAGFHGIEPWVSELDAYTKAGGTLKDLGKRIADAGLTVENAIAFNGFLNDDATERAASMERLKTDMDKVAQIGGARIAAPPGNNRAAVSLDNAATYYREALEMGERMGVQPLLELWGTHPVLGPLRNGIYVTVATGRPDASLLLDVFHLYKSGTPFTSLKQINGARVARDAHQRLSPGSRPVDVERQQPDLPGRRRGAVPGDPPRPSRQRVPGLLLARALQQGLLGEERRRESLDGAGEDSCGREAGPRLTA